jgi:CheY-like chemotaxis protein
MTRYACFTAPTGESGLRMAREMLPAVITLDLVLPDMRGTDVLRELKRVPETRDIPVIVVSIHGDEHFWLEGAFDILSKPIDREKLRAAVAEALAIDQA